MLSLAKKRHYYSRLAGRISVAGILVNIIPTAIIAANNDGTDEGMKLRQVAHAILNFLTAAQVRASWSEATAKASYRLPT